MTMVLDDNLWVLILNSLHQTTEECRTTYTRHILQADLRSTSLDELIRQISIVLDRMHWRVGDTERSLRDHPCFLRILDRRDHVARVIQTVENTCDIYTLRLLDLVHQATHVCWYGEHTQTVEPTV